MFQQFLKKIEMIFEKKKNLFAAQNSFFAFKFLLGKTEIDNTA